MTPERWEKLKELCALALERAPDERSPFLAKACLQDEALLREAESMIALATSGGGILNGPIWKDFAPKAEPAVAEVKVIGSYHLLQRIGEGGMGEVWLAEQKEPVRRRVAVKLVKAGMNTREVIGRFESERQALALMEHPAIAKVFDAGSTRDGAPYFAMEYVAGVPINEYCDNHRLPIKERLDLFIQVCEGVRHAHQKAVIHRDLKPSNILVEDLDGQPVAKIIDFGVAKALGQKLTAHTMFTRVGSLVGTPEYMSPEQALSSGEDVDTRTDVYSLGIIFYELMAGAPPIELRKLAFDEYLRKLRDEDPPKPSTKIRTQDAATSTELARRRQTELATLVKEIGGDLDSIALKALEKDRSRRYGSVADFAADIARYLRHEAVLAVPPSVAYRARKFASRHRWGVAMAGAFVVVLTAATAISIRQSQRANREAAIAATVNDFLQNDLLAQAGASKQALWNTKPDPDLKVRTALDRAAARVTGKFDRQPEVEAAIRQTIGQTYMDLGVYPEARSQLERAWQLQQQASGMQNVKALTIGRLLATVARRQGNYPEAEKLFRQVLEQQRRTLGPEHPETLYSMGGLAIVYYNEGKYAEAESLGSQTLQIRQRVLGPEHADTLKSMNDLGWIYNLELKYSQAEQLLLQTVEISRRVVGPEHPNTLIAMNNLAIVYLDERKYAQAEQLFTETLEIRRRTLGSDHVDTANSLETLSDVYEVQGKYKEAELTLIEALKIQRSALGPEHHETLLCMNSLADAYEKEGKYTEAEGLYSQAEQIERRVRGPEHHSTLLSMDGRAEVYGMEGDYARAEPLFLEILATKRRVFGEKHPATLDTLSKLAVMYQRQGKYALASTHAAEALAGRRNALGSDDSDTMVSAADLALAHISEKRFTEAEPLAREVLEFERKKEPDEWQYSRAQSLHGASLAGETKYAEAEPLLLEGYQGMLAQKDRIDIPDRYHLDRAHEWLVKLYVDWKKPDQAAQWKKRQ